MITLEQLRCAGTEVGPAEQRGRTHHQGVTGSHDGGRVAEVDEHEPAGHENEFGPFEARKVELPRRAPSGTTRTRSCRPCPRAWSGASSKACTASCQPGTFTVLGTDGLGRSDTRDELRRHFEIDAAHVVVATLAARR